MYKRAECYPYAGFLGGIFSFRTVFIFLVALTKKKLCAVGSFPPQNHSKLTNQTGQNHCDLCNSSDCFGSASTSSSFNWRLTGSALNIIFGLILGTQQRNCSLSQQQNYIHPSPPSLSRLIVDFRLPKTTISCSK